MNYAHAVRSLEAHVGSPEFLASSLERQTEVLNKLKTYRKKAVNQAKANAENAAKQAAQKEAEAKKNVQAIELLKEWRPGFSAKLSKTLGIEVKVEFWNTPEQAVKTGETGTVKINGFLNKRVFTILNDVFLDYRVSPGLDGVYKTVRFETTEIFFLELT